MANLSYEELLFTAIKNGQTAKSVYDIWLELGNVGTPEDFINSLRGSSSVMGKATIPSSNWVSFDGIYKATISDTNVTSNSVVNVNFDSASINAAISSGVLGYTNSIDGAFEIYANFLPTQTLNIDYSVVNP